MVTVVQEVVFQSIVPSRKVESVLQKILGLVGRGETILAWKHSR